MKTVKRCFECGRSDVISIYLIGDIHLGTILCEEGELQKYVKEIKGNPLAYWIGMGDLVDGIVPSDKRWDDGVISDWVHPDNVIEDERSRINDLLSPIKGQCLGLLYGNHEDKHRIYNHVNIHQNLCNDFGVENLGFDCFMVFHFTRAKSSVRTLVGAFTHGSGHATTDTAKMAKLLAFMRNKNANIFGYAHTHGLDTKIKIELGVDIDKIQAKSKTKLGLLTGCFTKTYTDGTIAGYGEKRNYDPVPIGCGVIKIKPFEKMSYRGYTLV